MEGLVFYYVLLIFSPNTHEFFSLKDKKEITITDAFQKPQMNLITNQTKQAANLTIGQQKLCLEKNPPKMYSTHNEGKSVIAERFNRTLYIDKLDDIVSKSNNQYHRTIKMKSVDVKSST